MTNPYSVPLEDLDAVHVAGEDQVTEQQDDPLRWAAGGMLVHPYGDGMTGDGGADGE